MGRGVCGNVKEDREMQNQTRTGEKKYRMEGRESEIHRNNKKRRHDILGATNKPSLIKL